MKKSTEELILSEIILLKTEVLRTNSRLGYIEHDLKEFKEDVNGRFDMINQRFDAVDQRFNAVEGGLDKLQSRFDFLEEKFDWTMQESSRYFLDHDKRIGILEGAH